jgi:hypothetical protein
VGVAPGRGKGGHAHAATVFVGISIDDKGLDWFQIPVTDAARIRPPSCVDDIAANVECAVAG